jgi:hypothetical protein
MDVTVIKDQIKKLTGIEKSEVIKVLKDLGPSEKYAVAAYLFPTNLLDGDLPIMIGTNRMENKNGWLSPEDSEIIVLLNAYRTPQYRRFIRHLLHSFTDPKMVYPLEGRFITSCCICKKNIFHFDIWKEECKKFPSLSEENRKEHLSYGSKNSNIELCLDCIIQINGLHKLLLEIEGPNYLDSGFCL